MHTPQEKRRYLATIGFRSEESGAALATEARILETLLEQDLAALPSVVMLERKDVGQLTAKQTLAGLDPLLRAAAVVVEGGLRRDADGHNLIATMVLRFAGQKKPRTASARIPRDDLIGGRKPLIEAVAAALETQSQNPVPLAPAEEAGLLTERAAALCSHRAFVEAGALYEAAFALEPNRERFIQGDYCYRNCTVAYYRYSQCDRLRASLRGNQFAKRYIEWNAKSQKQPFAHDSDARLVYNGPAYANLFTKSVEELLAREPSVKIWHDCTRGFQHYCGIEPGADEAEVLQLGREIRHVQEMKWDLVAGMRRQRGIPIDELLLCRLFDTASCITPAEATGELKAAMAKIDRLQAAGHRVAVKRAPFFGIVNEPIDRVATLFRAVTVMVDMRWHAEELLPLLDWLSAYNDPAVKLIGLYGKTRLKGEPGRDATEKLVEALSQPSCPVARFVVEQMAAESGYAPPETREIWRPLWATATTPRNPMRPNVFINLRQTRDRIGPWARYRITPVSLEGMKEASAQMVHLVVDESGTGPGEGGPVFILWDLTGSPTDRDHRTFRSSEEVRQYLLTRLRPEDGTMTEVERFKMKVLPYRAEMVLERNALYFNPQGGPLAIVRRGDVAYVREADGLPMPEVGPLAWFADRLYLGGAGALARFDPESRRFELLASSRSVAPRHELDGGGLWTVRSILPDAEAQVSLVIGRQRLVEAGSRGRIQVRHLEVHPGRRFAPPGFRRPAQLPGLERRADCLSPAHESRRRVSSARSGDGKGSRALQRKKNRSHPRTSAAALGAGQREHYFQLVVPLCQRQPRIQNAAERSELELRRATRPRGARLQRRGQGHVVHQSAAGWRSAGVRVGSARPCAAQVADLA